MKHAQENRPSRRGRGVSDPKNLYVACEKQIPEGRRNAHARCCCPGPPCGSASFADRAVSADHTSADNVSLSTRAICAALALLLRDYCCERTRPIMMADGGSWRICGGSATQSYDRSIRAEQPCFQMLAKLGWFDRHFQLIEWTIVLP